MKFNVNRDQYWKDGVHRSAMPFREDEDRIKKLNKLVLDGIKDWRLGSYNIRNFQLRQATAAEFDAMRPGQYFEPVDAEQCPDELVRHCQYLLYVAIFQLLQPYHFFGPVPNQFALCHLLLSFLNHGTTWSESLTSASTRCSVLRHL